MKILYLECKMGIAGDMLASALLSLFDDKEKVIEELNAMGIPKVKFVANKTEKCGIVGDHISVLIDGIEEESVDAGEHEHNHHDHDHHQHEDHNEHRHNSLYQIEEIIE